MCLAHSDYARNGVGLRAKPCCSVRFWCTSVDLCCALHLQSSPVTTVTSPNSTPAKTIDTSPPVDLFATASAAVPVRSVHEYVENRSLIFWFDFCCILCTLLMPHSFARWNPVLIPCDWGLLLQGKVSSLGTLRVTFSLYPFNPWEDQCFHS